MTPSPVSGWKIALLGAGLGLTLLGLLAPLPTPSKTPTEVVRIRVLVNPGQAPTVALVEGSQLQLAPPRKPDFARPITRTRVS